MASMFGNTLHLSIFGQSHSPAIGCTIDGLPAGIAIDEGQLQAFLDRRAPGNDSIATSRHEDDCPEFLSGITNGYTNGAPLTAIIRNTNTKSVDYDQHLRIPRPGHADYTAQIKYKGYQDVSGGGHFSGRLTAPLCIAGGIALQILAAQGIRIAAHISQLGPRPISDEPLNDIELIEAQIDSIAHNTLPCIDADTARKMRDCILEAKKNLDSVGGVIECAAYGLPAGIGSPIFDGLENRIAQIVFGIPAVKGIEFGSGFAAAKTFGSTNNDEYRIKDGVVSIQTNHAGGILGGISTGMPLVWHMAVKPTPSIARAQQSLDVQNKTNVELTIQGRHDPCIVPRAVPVAEAACAFALLDALLECKGF